MFSIAGSIRASNGDFGSIALKWVVYDRGVGSRRRTETTFGGNQMHRFTVMFAALATIWISSCGRSEPSTTSSRTAPPTPPPAPSIMVFAAASTTDAIVEAARLYERRHNLRITCSFDASSTLAKQIESGAAADV